MELLPLEILERIYGYLGVSDRLAASSVCKRWYYASLNVRVWKDAAVRFRIRRATEGLNVLVNSERPFSSVVFEDCNTNNCSASQDCCILFRHAVEMCKVVGQRLHALQFKNCSISGFCLTDILTKCPNLQHLSVINCESLFLSQMWLEGPEEINQLKLSLQNVKELDLSFNRNLTDMFFARLAQIFTNVKSLSLVNCPINFHRVIFKRYYPRSTIEPSDHIFTYFWVIKYISDNATRITSINFSGTSIDSSMLKELAQIEGLQLESIDLSHCFHVSASGLKEFCHYQKKLLKLALPDHMDLDEILPEICFSLLELRELSVGSCWSLDKMDSLLYMKMQCLTKLVKLDLGSSCEIIVLKFIESLHTGAFLRLRHLSLYKDVVNDFIFLYMISHLLNITYLDLGCTEVGDKSLIAISKHLVCLRVLQLPQCTAITDGGLMGYLQIDPVVVTPGGVLVEHADRINFGKCEVSKWIKFDEDHPVSLSNLKCLQELNLYDIAGVSDDGLKAAVVFKELRRLYIGGSSKITDKGLLAIARNNCNLEVLCLRNSFEVTENGIAKVLSILPRLKLLDLQGCGKLTNSALAGVMKPYNFKLKYLF